MPLTPRYSAREQKAAFELHEALGSSLNIRTVLERAYPPLLRLVPADYSALGISSSGKPEDYEWIAPQIPPAFFAAYPEMAAHDFVRTSVARQPNAVLRDEDMISRADLEANVMYRLAHEVGAPLEQVMAVMLHIDNRWQSGLSLYRERQREFSERERAILQRETPMIVNAVRNCHLFSDAACAAADGNAELEALLDDRRESIVMVASPATEVRRTARAAQLIDNWFAPHERRDGHLPEPLAFVLTQTAAPPLAQVAPERWTRRGAEATLQVSFIPLSGCMGKADWMLRLEELPHAIPLPPQWQGLLTAREKEVTSLALRGWDNGVIAVELSRSGRPVSEDTVKTHMRNIFIKLCVESRAQLIALAFELHRR